MDEYGESAVDAAGNPVGWAPETSDNSWGDYLPWVVAADLYERLAIEAGRTVRSVASEAGQTARTGASEAGTTARSVAGDAADVAPWTTATAALVSIGTAIAAASVPTLAIGSALALAVGDQVATGGKGRRAALRAVGL